MDEEDIQLFTQAGKNIIVKDKFDDRLDDFSSKLISAIILHVLGFVLASFSEFGKLLNSTYS